jgi:hypothetical protein
MSQPITAHTNDCYLSVSIIIVNVSKSTTVMFLRARRCILKPRPVQLFGEPIKQVDTSHYSVVNLDTRLTLSSHIAQVRKKKFTVTMGVSSSALKRKSGPFVKYGVLLYKELIRPMIDYACPIWRRFVAITHIGRLQVLQSKCLCLATGVPW